MSMVNIIPAVEHQRGAEQTESKTLQSAPNVFVIPATKRSIQGGGQLKNQQDIRVAAYCRVSTGDERQQTSYTNQRAFYSEMIQRREGWKFAGIYADESISGTSRVKRREFNRMIEDALQGKVDYIVTKSISRFARNTVDTLNCVRMLRQQNPPVGIYFEKENIDTLDAAGELILTILSALAQDESRSISDNIRWTFQKNFQAGKPQINLNRMLGYDKGENGEWIINRKQAEIVEFIFNKYVNGYSANSIARQANEQDMRTVNGKRWTAGAVLDILRNEKYVGDLEMQKTITKDFLTHRSIKNRGEAPKYYVKDHHRGIIDRLTWDKVQIILNNGRNSQEKQKSKKKGAAGSPFLNLTCAEMINGSECGESFSRMTYSGTAIGYSDERSKDFNPDNEIEKYVYAYPVWRCKRKMNEKTEVDMNLKCPSSVIRECALEQSFMEMLYWLKRDYDARGEKSWLSQEFRKAYDAVCKRSSANSYSIQRMEILDGQIKEVESEISAGGRGDIIGDLRLRLEEYRREKTVLEADQGEIIVMKRNYDFFLQCLKELPEENEAGMKMNINGIDVQGSLFCDKDGGTRSGADRSVNREQIKATAEMIAQAPDFLRFERGIYLAFIRSGKVKGDEVEYLTNFGVRIRSIGNSRTLKSFLGFRRCRDNGNVEFLDALWKVNDKKIQYRRNDKKVNGKRKTAETVTVRK